MANHGSQLSGLAAFNAASPEAATRDVLAYRASGSFAKAIADCRRHPGTAALQTAADAAFTTLTWGDIVENMDAHPRIGDRVPSGGWSAAEHSGAASARDQVRQALAEG